MCFLFGIGGSHWDEDLIAVYTTCTLGLQIIFSCYRGPLAAHFVVNDDTVGNRLLRCLFCFRECLNVDSLVQPEIQHGWSTFTTKIRNGQNLPIRWSLNSQRDSRPFCLLGVFSLSVIESAVCLQHEYPITHFQVRGYLLSSLLLQIKILHLQLGKFLLFTMRWCCISSFSQIL